MKVAQLFGGGQDCDSAGYNIVRENSRRRLPQLARKDGTAGIELCYLIGWL